VDTSIMAGNTNDIGLRATALPEVKKNTIIPAIATIIRTGNSLVIGLAGTARGASAGPSTTISASENRGPDMR
jgi:hypothetical protein